MDKGRMLSEAANVLVQVAGGPGMTLSEVEILMQELGRHVRDHTQILFGTSVDGRMGNRLSVTLISSIVTEGEISAPVSYAAPVTIISPEPVAPPPIWEQQGAQPEPFGESTAEVEIESPLEEESLEEGAPEELIPSQPPVSIEAPIKPLPDTKKPITGPRLIVPKKKPLVVKEPPTTMPVEKIVQAKQEVMQFEPVTRGRFEKSEPTIVEGQDLDVPTYLRKNVRVK
jgi:cell division protein FtsZ